MASQRLGAFRLEHRLEASRWGLRWLARPAEGGPWRIVEVLHDWMVDSSDALIENERRFAGLSLPHVLSHEGVQRLGSDAQAPVLMERREVLVHHLPPPRLLARSPREAAAIVLQLGRGLEALAGCSAPEPFVHGGIGLETSWTDALGIARLDASRLSAAEIRTTRVGLGVVRSSFHDLSPEQVRGLRLSPASDVYQLGVMLAWLSTGRRPFAADSDFGTLENIISGTFARPSTLVNGYDPAVEQLVCEALQLDPGARPALGDWLGALADLLGPEVDRPPLEASGNDLMDWLRAHLFEDTPKVAALVQARLDLTTHPLASDYIERHVLATVRASLDAVASPTLAEAWLLGQFEAGQHALARWAVDPTLPQGSRWVAQWLAADPRCELPDLAVASFAATTLPHDGPPLPASASPPEPPTPFVHIGPVQLTPCTMAWDAMTPVPDSTGAPGHARHCDRCDQQVTQVETLEGLITLAGKTCLRWHPRAAEAEPIASPAPPVAPTVLVADELLQPGPAEATAAEPAPNLLHRLRSWLRRP